MFCALEIVWGVLRAVGPIFYFCALGRFFGGIEGAGSCFHVLRSMTHFGRYRGHEVQFSCFALPNSFGEVPRASSPVYIFYVPRLIFGGTGGV
jgi:hypothetical protein